MSQNQKPIKLITRTKNDRLDELTDVQLMRIGELALMR
jgi:hypothetical protein